MTKSRTDTGAKTKQDHINITPLNNEIKVNESDAELSIQMSNQGTYELYANELQSNYSVEWIKHEL